MEQVLPTETIVKPNHTKTSFILAILSLTMAVIFIGLAKFGVSLYDTFQVRQS